MDGSLTTEAYYCTKYGEIVGRLKLFKEKMVFDPFQT